MKKFGNHFIRILKNKILFGIFLLILGGLFLGSISLEGIVRAQGTGIGWSTPANLSNSGSTTNPILVIDSKNISHVIWVDKFAGYVYTRFDGSEWSQPIPVAFPFGQMADLIEAGIESSFPKLILDNQGYVHAFWVDQANTLFYSRAPVSRFGDVEAWSARQALAESALDASIVIDSNNYIHLSYIRDLDTQNLPAGVYYRRSSDGGANWSPGIPLYTSLYFRSLTPDEAHVRITSAPQNNTEHIFVAWDNQLLKRVFIVTSLNGGKNWEDPKEIDRPNENNGFATPFEIQLDVNGDNLLLLWKVGDPSATSCISNYQFSSDGGISWSERQQLFQGISGCPLEELFLHSSDNLTMLIATFQTQVYLLAWDGSRWSIPQAQSELSGFEDPDTYVNVSFDCRSPVLDNNNNNLYVVGCESSREGDIWLLYRPLGSVEAWFPQNSAWSKPIKVTSTHYEISSPVLETGPDRSLHALWSQTEDTNSQLGLTTVEEKSIYYAGWDGENWSQPTVVLRSPTGDAVNPSAVVDPSGRMFVVWSEGEPGEIFFSWANADRASYQSEWTAPKSIPLVRSIGSTPEVTIDVNGGLVVTYAVSLNEDRGI